MVTYTKRTCHYCGVKKPQPEMHRKTISRVTSSYQRSLSGREVVGTLLGEKRSQQSVQRWLWAPNKRSRTSFREVWVCSDCNESVSAPSELKSGDVVLSAIIIFIIFFVVVVIYDSRTGTSDRTPVVESETGAVVLEENSSLNDVNATGSGVIQPSMAVETMNSHVIQVAAFSEMENLLEAEALLDRLGLSHTRESAQVSGRHVFRLLVLVNENYSPDFTISLLRNNGYTDAFVRVE